LFIFAPIRKKTIVKRTAKLIVLAGISALTFSSCDQAGKSTEGTASTETSESVSVADLKVAYVLTDSVIARYTYFKEKSGEITQKGKNFESELGSRAKGFEQEVANFQQTAQAMTPNQARAKQDELVKKEQNLMTYRDNIMQELSGDEAKLYSDVYDQIQVYLTEYAEANNLEMILSYTRGGAIWYSNKSLDITDIVVEGINKKYEASKTPAATK
jgi:outer membrane protein